MGPEQHFIVRVMYPNLALYLLAKLKDWNSYVINSITKSHHLLDNSNQLLS